MTPEELINEIESAKPSVTNKMWDFLFDDEEDYQKVTATRVLMFIQAIMVIFCVVAIVVMGIGDIFF